jgi:hypothetical protein
MSLGTSIIGRISMVQPPGTAVGPIRNRDVYDRSAHGRWSTQRHRIGGVFRAAGE